VRRLYIGKAKCCGVITAAMVDDETTTADEVAKFAKSIAKSNRQFGHLELSDTEKLAMERCKCGDEGESKAKGDQS
jgi:hypothetical protein